MENTVADGNNSIEINAIIAVPLKCLSNFWRSLEIPLISCKVELKIKWKRQCVLAAAGVDNANDGNVIFTIKDRKLFAPVLSLSANNNQKLPKLVSKGFVRSVYWNEKKNEK